MCLCKSNENYEAVFYLVFVSEFNNMQMRISGCTRRWTRNCCQKAFKEFRARIEWVQKRSKTNCQASTPKSRETSCLLYWGGRKNTDLWIHAQQKPGLLHFRFESQNLMDFFLASVTIINISQNIENFHFLVEKWEYIINLNYKLIRSNKT